MEFNTEQSLIALFDDKSLRIHCTKTAKIMEIISIEDIKLVRLHGRSNFVFFTTNKNPNVLKIYDAVKIAVIGTIQLPGEIIQCQTNAKYISVLANNKIYLYTIDNHEQYAHLFSVSGSTYILGSDKLIYIDTVNNEEVIKTFHFTKNIDGPAIKAHENKIKCMCINFDESLIATASIKGTIIRIFSIESGQKLYEFRRGIGSANIEYITFNSNSNYLAVSSSTNTVHIYNMIDQSLNRKSRLTILGGYFDSEWSFAWYHAESINNVKKCCFDKDDNLIIYKENKSRDVLIFDKTTGGECQLKN